MLFLTILKWIGIVLLAILLFVLFLCALILFVPVRYRLTVKCDEEYQLEYGFLVRYLFPLVFIRKSLKNDGIYLHILGIPVKNFAKDTEENTENSQEVEEKNTNIIDTEEKEAHNRNDKPLSQNLAQKKDKNEQQKKKERAKGPSKLDKVKSLRTKLSKMTAFVKDQGTKESIRYLKEKLFVVLKHIAPRKAKGYVQFGTGDPASTGMLTGVISMMPFVYAKGLSITPDFEQKIVICDLCIKGRIRIFNLVVVLVSVYLKDEIRKLMSDYRRLKEEL